jgi:hypothetical protein
VLAGFIQGHFADGWKYTFHFDVSLTVILIWTVEFACDKNLPDFMGVDVMTMLEDDLLAALKELQETSLIMTSGKLRSATEMERYHRAIEWSKRVIALAEGEK